MRERSYQPLRITAEIVAKRLALIRYAEALCLAKDLHAPSKPTLFTQLTANSAETIRKFTGRTPPPGLVVVSSPKTASSRGDKAKGDVSCDLPLFMIGEEPLKPNDSRYYYRRLQEAET